MSSKPQPQPQAMAQQQPLATVTDDHELVQILQHLLTKGGEPQDFFDRRARAWQNYAQQRNVMMQRIEQARQFIARESEMLQQLTGRMVETEQFIKYEWTVEGREIPQPQAPKPPAKPAAQPAAKAEPKKAAKPQIKKVK